MLANQAKPTDECLVSQDAVDLYGRVAQSGAQPTADEEHARQQLLNLGFAREDPELGIVLEDPVYAGAKLRASLQAQVARVSELVSALAPAYESRSAGLAGAIELLKGSSAINDRLGRLLEGCKATLEVCQPGGIRKRPVLDETRQRDFGMLTRGVEMRTLYHADARAGSAMYEWVATFTAAGAQIRTLDEPFTRMIIIDREIAIIPGDGILTTSEEATAYVIHDSGVAQFLARIFERDWNRATPWSQGTTDGMTERQEVILRGLAIGETYETIARRLDVTTRTVKAEVKQLKDQIGVETLFELGCAWARREMAERTR